VVYSVCFGGIALGVAVHAGPDDFGKAGYELRMEGKCDEALAILTKSTMEDEGYGAAQYELARLHYHLALGNPRNMEASMQESQVCIERATKAEPGNAAYRVFEGHVAFMRGYAEMHMKQNNSGAKEQFRKACQEFEAAIRIEGDYPEMTLYLVELYGTLGNNVGGNKAKARKYAKQLKAKDAVFGAKADSILLPGKSNKVKYWQKILKKHPGNSEVLEELAKAYLGAGNTEEGVKYIEKAYRKNPKKAGLFLDLSRYHMMRAMQARNNNEKLQEAAGAADDAVKEYLDCNPVGPMRAYGLGVRAKLNYHLGNKEKADGFMEEANGLDRNFSKAFGAPNPDLFIRPGVVSDNHRYLMRPY
jgi:tetratricopeptide (TPR) repeat protein